MTFKGINFRASSGFVTDPADTTYCLKNTYPTTRGGLTFGWSDANAASSDSLNTLDPRIAGWNQANSTGRTFRYDLPNGPGTYKIRFAAGSHGGTWTGYHVFWDGPANTGNRKFDLDNRTTVAAATFIDAMGNQHAEADWPANQVERTVSFANSYLTISNGFATQIALRHLALEYQAITMVDAVLTDESGATLTTIYERNPNGSRIAKITASASAALSLAGADAAYFQIVTVGTEKWLAHSSSPLLIASAGANADFTIRQTDATAPNGPIYDTNFSLAITSAGAKPTDTSVYALIETQNWLNIAQVRAVTDAAWAGYSSGSFNTDVLVTTYAGFVSALSAINTDGRTSWDRIRIANGTYTGATISYSRSYGVGGGLLIEPDAGADPEFNIEFSDLKIHGLHVRNLRSPGYGISFYQWRFGTTTSAGINSTGRFNKAVFTGCRFGLMFRSGITQNDVAGGTLNQIYMPHGESIRIEGSTFYGVPGVCLLVPGVRAVVVKNNDLQKCHGDFLGVSNADTYNSVQGVFADNHQYFDCSLNRVRNEIDYSGYVNGAHPDFLQIRAFFNNVQFWSTSKTITNGQYILNQQVSPPRIYVATAAGTTASSGTGPSGTGTGITDGTVTWNYVSDYTTASNVYGVVEENSINSASVISNDGADRQFILDSNGSKNCPVYLSVINNAVGNHSAYGGKISGGRLFAEFNTLGSSSTLGPSPTVNAQQFVLEGNASGRALHNAVRSASNEASTGGIIIDDEVVIDWASAAVSPNRPGDNLAGPFSQLSGAGNRWGYPTLQDDGLNTPADFATAMRSILRPLSGTAGIYVPPTAGGLPVKINHLRQQRIA